VIREFPFWEILKRKQSNWEGNFPERNFEKLKKTQCKKAVQANCERVLGRWAGFQSNTSSKCFETINFTRKIPVPNLSGFGPKT